MKNQCRYSGIGGFAAGAILPRPEGRGLSRILVNEVTKVAKEFHATEQLRERVRNAMEPLISAARGASTEERPPRQRAKSVKFRCQYGAGEAEYDSWFPMPRARQ